MKDDKNTARQLCTSDWQSVVTVVSRRLRYARVPLMVCRQHQQPQGQEAEDVVASVRCR